MPLCSRSFVTISLIAEPIHSKQQNMPLDIIHGQCNIKMDLK
jgi:hypothetical protein